MNVDPVPVVNTAKDEVGEDGRAIELEHRAQLGQLEHALRIAEARFAGIVEIAADAIISVNDAQHITLFNEGAARIFGYASAEVLGQPLEVLLPERFRATHGEHVRQFGHGSEHARRMGHRREISGLRKGGEEFPAEASISRFSVSGATTFNVVLRDITERKRAEDDLRSLYETAQRAVRARDETVAVVSHDLRNPVNAIAMIAASLLRADPAPDPAALAEQLRVVVMAARQADALIADLLDVTRIETGSLRVHRAPQPIAPIIDSAIEVLRPLAAERDVSVVVAASEALPDALVDGERTHQVISNLAGNAIKFTPRGGRVSIRAEWRDEEIVISVLDTGPGIGADQVPHLFDRYWQAKRTARGGAGLGLAIAKGIVEAHGGRIWVESRPGEGSTFSFTVPGARLL
ncbi:MAG: PAS domain-containing sensor histidine kinase [Gemmatimonadaceae bacterium]